MRDPCGRDTALVAVAPSPVGAIPAEGSRHPAAVAPNLPGVEAGTHEAPTRSAGAAEVTRLRAIGGVVAPAAANTVATGCAVPGAWTLGPSGGRVGAPSIRDDASTNY